MRPYPSPHTGRARDTTTAGARMGHMSPVSVSPDLPVPGDVANSAPTGARSPVRRPARTQ
jgi:hypothetical protein